MRKATTVLIILLGTLVAGVLLGAGAALYIVVFSALKVSFEDAFPACSIVGVVSLGLLLTATYVPSLIGKPAESMASALRPSREPGREYMVGGFCLPHEFARFKTHREEYVIGLFMQKEMGAAYAHEYLRVTQGLDLFGAFGWDLELAYRAVAGQHDARMLLEEAKALAESYPAPEVIQYLGHASGARRGLELLRDDIPFEFGSLISLRRKLVPA